MDHDDLIKEFGQQQQQIIINDDLPQPAPPLSSPSLLDSFETKLKRDLTMASGSKNNHLYIALIILSNSKADWISLISYYCKIHENIRKNRQKQVELEKLVVNNLINSSEIEFVIETRIGQKELISSNWHPSAY
jgi:hypothetical protein